MMIIIKLCMIPSVLFTMYLLQYVIYMLYSIFGLNNLDCDNNDLNLYKDFDINKYYISFLFLPYIYFIFNSISVLQYFKLLSINICITYMLMLIFKSKKIKINKLLYKESSFVEIELLYSTYKNNYISGLTIIKGRNNNLNYERYLNLKHLKENAPSMSNIISIDNIVYCSYGSYFDNFDDAFLNLMNILLKNRTKREVIINNFEKIYYNFNPNINFSNKFDFSGALIKHKLI